jgi:hypothetical protein
VWSSAPAAERAGRSETLVSFGSTVRCIVFAPPTHHSGISLQKGAQCINSLEDLNARWEVDIVARRREARGQATCGVSIVLSPLITSVKRTAGDEHDQPNTTGESEALYMPVIPLTHQFKEQNRSDFNRNVAEHLCVNFEITE